MEENQNNVNERLKRCQRKLVFETEEEKKAREEEQKRKKAIYAALCPDAEDISDDELEI